MYEEIFKTFDTIPTVTFLIYFTILYLLSIFLLHCLLWSCSQSYQSLGYGRQSYVLCKLLEVNIFIFICYMGINALLREDVNLFDTTNHKQNPQMMVNMSTTYVVKDVMEVLINKKLARTTLVHHVCVVLAYLHVISVLHADYNVEGIFKVRTFLISLFIFDNILCWQCFIYYAAFTSLNFPYKLFLALRFFVRRDGRWHRLMKTVTLVHKLLCLGLNVYWQSFYLARLWPVVRHSGVMTGELRLTDSLGVVLTLLSLS